MQDTGRPVPVTYNKQGPLVETVKKSVLRTVIKFEPSKSSDSVYFIEQFFALTSKKPQFSVEELLSQRAYMS